MLSFLLWVTVLVLCWPLALLALVLYPIVWLLLLPFRILGFAVEGVLGLLKAILFLPARVPLPPHLRRFVVAQDYAAYTARDQAVWRHVLRRLTTHLAGRAHPRYLAGLAATGIGLAAIPSLDEMHV